MRFTLPLGILLAGCATPTPQAPTPVTTPLAIVITQTPAPLAPGLNHFPGYQESLKIRIPVGDADSVARGAGLYEKHCAACHARDLSGDTETDQAHLRDLRSRSSYKLGISDQALYRSIKFGIPGSAMGRSALANAQVFDLIHFLRSRHKP